MFIRRLPKFEYHSPSSIAEALDQLTRYKDRGKVFAGGTDLFVAMKKRKTVPDHLINLKGIDALKGIQYSEKEGLKIGGLVTIGELERSDLIRNNFAMLHDAVEATAGPQVRNLGTIGGNLCSAVPSADTAPPLIAACASVKLIGSRGERTVRVQDFFKGPGESVLRQDEILAEVLVPAAKENSAGAYFKLMRRNAMDLAVVGVAAHLRLDERLNICKEAAIALGAVAPTPIRAPKAEQVLKDKQIEENLARDAGRVASREASPISDIRASENYRSEMIVVLTKRAVMKAQERIRERRKK